MKFTDEQAEHLRSEFKPRKRKRYRCQDMMCGAEDCANCYPDQREEKEETDGN